MNENESPGFDGYIALDDIQFHEDPNVECPIQPQEADPAAPTTTTMGDTTLTTTITEPPDSNLYNEVLLLKQSQTTITSQT